MLKVSDPSPLSLVDLNEVNKLDLLFRHCTALWTQALPYGDVNGVSNLGPPFLSQVSPITCRKMPPMSQGKSGGFNMSSSWHLNSVHSDSLNRN